jgi:hypothetical protein
MFGLEKCRTEVTHAGVTQFRDLDLLVLEGVPPIAVLEWTLHRDGRRIPSIAFQLDAKYLRPLAGHGLVTHQYTVPVASPIRLS